MGTSNYYGLSYAFYFLLKSEQNILICIPQPNKRGFLVFQQGQDMCQQGQQLCEQGHELVSTRAFFRETSPTFIRLFTVIRCVSSKYLFFCSPDQKFSIGQEGQPICQQGPAQYDKSKVQARKVFNGFILKQAKSAVTSV